MDLIEVVADPSALKCCDADRATRLRAGSGRNLAAAGDVLQAIAQPLRLRLLDALDTVGELCVCDAAWICEASDALTSHHLKALVAAGLVDRRRDGRLAMYRLTDAGERTFALIGELAR